MRSVEMIEMKVRDSRTVIRCDRCNRTIGSAPDPSIRRQMAASHPAFTVISVIRVPPNADHDCPPCAPRTFEVCDKCLDVLFTAGGDFGGMIAAAALQPASKGT